ncbi:cytochrome c [Massilia sp. RP-1-19]|uniref:Cytochrome c n=1 Tax=Massilia polaris TaxID=2728846 RepID=A0A848HLR4_9BURK|nr:c-type cytochrome [Massilia polaris]NML62132.1 cytochrome c [Massilia polaris]
MRNSSSYLAASAILMSCVVNIAAAAPPSAATLERGRYLMNGVVACANCHMARGPKGEYLMDKGLSGGMPFDDRMFKAYAPNITQDGETGIGRLTDAQLAKAIREGIRPDGSVIGPPMPIEFYRHISDDDLAAIIAVLKVEPAVRSAVPKSRFNFALPPAYGPPVMSVKAPSRADKVKYGEYLVAIGHCMECHTQRDQKGMLLMSSLGSGGRVFPGPWGESVSRNLTTHESGLKGWSDAQISKAVRAGVNRDGAPYKPPMAFQHYQNIDDADMAAITAYLRTLPPRPFGK